MNQPLGHPSGFPAAAWSPPPAPPGPGGYLEMLLHGAAGLADLLLPLLVGLAGALSTWVILEVIRARTGRRALLPGRPPVWTQAPQHLAHGAGRRRNATTAPASRAAVATMACEPAGSDRPFPGKRIAAPPIRHRTPP